MEKTERELLMIRYLLGEVSPEERSHLEEQYSTDQGVFVELMALENDMLDSCARGDLPDSERKKIQNWYSATLERRNRRAFAGVVVGYVSSAVSAKSYQDDFSERFAWGFHRLQPYGSAAALVALLLAAGASWLLVSNQRLRHEVTRMHEDQVLIWRQEQLLENQLSQLREQLRETMQNERSDAGAILPAAVASLTLTPDSVRGSKKANALTVSPKTTWVCLSVSVGGGYRGYNAELDTANGVRVFVKNGLKAQRVENGRAILRLKLPASLFANDDYALKLSGTTAAEPDDLGAYFFRVNRP